MTADNDHRTRELAELLETEITAALRRIRTRLARATGAETLLDRLDTLDERRIGLGRRLDAMPDIGGAWGMASDTPLAGLADVLLRVQRLEEVLAEDPVPEAVATAERVAAEPLPRPVRLLSRQRELLEGVRRGAADPWLSGQAGH